MLFFFFFQAEDGIRDLIVTGVQTCALPIWLLRRRRETGKLERSPRGGGLVSPIHGRIADLLCRIVGEMNDATLEELTKALIERAEVKTSCAGVVRAMARLGFTRKKSRWSRPSATRPSTAIGGRSTARSSPR